MPTLRPSFCLPRSRPLSFIAAFGLWLSCACSAWADVVWLNNGDRLTGTIKSVDSGVLLVSTGYGGDIRIQLDQVRTFSSDSELVILDSAGNHQQQAKFEQADDGSVTLHPAQTTLPLTEIDTIARPNPLLLDTAFKGRIDVAANRKSASTDTENVAASAELQARRDVWRHQLGMSYARAKDDDSISTNNYGGSYSLDRFLSQQAFWQGRVTHKHDQIEELQRQTSYGTGPGYQFWDNELGSFSLAGLISRVRYGYTDNTRDAFYAATLRWNYARYFRGKQFELYTRGEVSRPLSNAAEYAINNEVGLRYRVTDWMSLYVKYLRERVDSRQGLNESTYSTGIGVTW